MVEHLSQTQREQLQLVLADYRAWATGEANPPSASALLPPGYSNTIVLLRGVKRRWVLRLGATPAPPGVSRQRELALQQIAAEAGLAPTVCYARPEQGILIMEYIEGKQERGTQPHVLASYLRRLHSLTASGEVMHSPDVFHHYALLGQPGERPATQRKPAPMPMPMPMPMLDTAQQQAVVATAIHIIEASPRGNHLCHNDLLSANRIRNGDRLTGLDWEYAAPGDPYFDLAVCASELDDRNAALLLQHYLERNPGADEQRHLQAQLIIYRLIERVWFMHFAPHTTAAKLARRKSEVLLALAAETAGFL